MTKKVHKANMELPPSNIIESENADDDDNNQMDENVMMMTMLRWVNEKDDDSDEMDNEISSDEVCQERINLSKFV